MLSMRGELILCAVNGISVVSRRNVVSQVERNLLERTVEAKDSTKQKEKLFG